MNAYRKIKFYTPGQLAACVVGLILEAVFFFVSIILFI